MVIERLKDTQSKQKGNNNPSDFIAYKKPYLYYIECKTTQRGTLPFSNIRQWDNLIERSKIEGVWAGVVCWFVNHDITVWIDIQLLQKLKELGYKSIAYHCSFVLESIAGLENHWGRLVGRKKRVLYHYEMQPFFNEIENAGMEELE